MLKFIPLALIALAAAPSYADDPDVKSGWVLEVSAADAVAGDVIPYRLAWVNHSAGPVRVPADLFKRVRARGERRTVGDMQPTIYLQGIVITTPPATRESVVVLPGQAIQRVGTLGDFLNDCEKGCLPGDYKLSIVGAADALIAGLEPADGEPPIAAIGEAALVWTATIPGERQAPAIAVGLGPGLDATLTRVGGKGKASRATVRLVVHNHLKHAVYFPPKDAFRVRWNGRAEDDGGGSGWNESGMGNRRPPWGPADGTLVKPGERWQVDVVADALPSTARHVWLRPHIEMYGTFGSTRAGKTPFYAVLHGVGALEIQLW